MDKLLPCPFCGGEVSIALCGDGFDAWWFITRGHGENACKCSLFMESEKFNKDSEMADFVADDLIAAWNRRTQPENKPLTLDELKQMDGEPVWVMHQDGSGARWGIVKDTEYGLCAVVDDDTAYWFTDVCGTIAYRSKPKEEHHEAD